ncbi:GNAT family N-acetyltransferase [Thermodesulfobacteriota bacterium]
MKDSAIDIAGYVPGSIGRVTEMHAKYYSENWGFDLFFEAKVASGLSEFLGRLDESRDGFWTALSKKRVVGSIAIDGSVAKSDGAHLRWFITDGEWRGHGLGHLLLKKALDFSSGAGHRRIYLWTFFGLDPARHLYEKFGFRLVEEHMGMQWGKEVKEQKFQLDIQF